MTNREPLRPYQKHIIDNASQDMPGLALFLTMGQGKTRIALEIANKFKAKRVLVISLPKIINDTWPNQLEEWIDGYSYISTAGKSAVEIEKFLKEPIPENTFVGLSFGILSSSTHMLRRPKRVDTEKSTLLAALKAVPWDVIIIDESTKIKDVDSIVTRAVLNLVYQHKAYVMVLTGTPNPENSLEFFPQIAAVDRGERLGESFYAFRSRFFFKPQYSFKWEAFPGTDTVIAELVSDICHIITKDEVKGLPPLLENDYPFALSEPEMAAYRQMKQQVISMPDKDITARNAGIVLGKLQQISSGFVYDDQQEAVFFGLSKLNALLALLEASPGKTIVVYKFNATRDILATYLALNDIKFAFSKDVSDKEFTKSDIQVLLLQPGSGAYGANYQYASNNLIWYEIELSSEKYEQTMKRIHRPGQDEICYVWYLIGKNTRDKSLVDLVKLKDITAVKLLKQIKELQ